MYYCLSVLTQVQLEQAIKLADHGLIKSLIDRGASLEGSLVIAAEFHKSTDTIKFLLTQGAKDINSSALSRAACSNKIDIAEVLLAYAGEPTGSDSSEALSMAAVMGHLDMVNLLLDRGFDINARDDLQQTPLLTACRADRPHLKVIQTLLERRADITAQDVKLQQTPYKGGDTPCKL